MVLSEQAVLKRNGAETPNTWRSSVCLWQGHKRWRGHLGQEEEQETFSIPSPQLGDWWGCGHSQMRKSSIHAKGLLYQPSAAPIVMHGTNE